MNKEEEFRKALEQVECEEVVIEQGEYPISEEDAKKICGLFFHVLDGYFGDGCGIGKSNSDMVKEILEKYNQNDFFKIIGHNFKNIKII